MLTLIEGTCLQRMGEALDFLLQMGSGMSNEEIMSSIETLKKIHTEVSEVVC